MEHKSLYSHSKFTSCLMVLFNYTIFWRIFYWKISLLKWEFSTIFISCVIMDYNIGVGVSSYIKMLKYSRCLMFIIISFSVLIDSFCNSFWFLSLEFLNKIFKSCDWYMDTECSCECFPICPKRIVTCIYKFYWLFISDVINSMKFWFVLRISFANTSS